MIELIIFFSLLAIGFFFGRRAEKKHFNSILDRESDTTYREMLAFSSRFPPINRKVEVATLVTGNVCVSVDYFKAVVAGLRGIIGGRVNTYETLIERARREAILRMKEEAIALDLDQIFNVKIETSSISKGGRNGLGTVEVFAYGTGLKYINSSKDS